RRPGDLDHVGIAGRLGDGRRIDEARVRHFRLPGLCQCMRLCCGGYDGGRAGAKPRTPMQSIGYVAKRSG
ncbi:MAG TPA: hypothetical protein VKE26_16075, partial [Xanthobacteraceae bacterium]|nr:hypothetical protein [Xanthobacteraceae bacterium]